MLIRMFGLFGIILGAAYFFEGTSLTGVLLYALSQKAHKAAFIQLLYVTWDFLFGVSMIVAGIGLLFLKEWARIMWLGLTPVLVLVHLSIILVSQWSRRGTAEFYLVWTGMVVLVAALSWWYLTEDKNKARFSKQTEPSN